MEKIKTFEIGKLYRINETDVPLKLVKKGRKHDFDSKRGGCYLGSVFKIKYLGVEYETMCDICFDDLGEYLSLNVESDYERTGKMYNWFGCTKWYACDLYEGECSEDNEWEVE